MKRNSLIGLILLILGVVLLWYGHFTYRTREEVIQLGPLKATVERTKTVPIPPLIGWILFGVGGGLLIFSLTREFKKNR